MEEIERIVLVTRSTPMQEAIAQFSTRDQARFMIERVDAPAFLRIQQYEDEFTRACDEILRAVPSEIKVQELDREYLPNYVFGPRDLVATLGPDGLVVNVAKYLKGQPILAFNPDPARIDGVLVPFVSGQAKTLLRTRHFQSRGLAMARASLEDGQELFAVNDLFIGQRSHISARYRIGYGEWQEDQSSSGIIVSTGAGSTGWYRSLVTGAAILAGNSVPDENAYRWDASVPELRFTVREPFVSRSSSANIVNGVLGPEDELEITSAMPANGTIFSDGVEEDFLPFSTGSVARIGVADRRVNLITG